ncbi:hypothetical protein TNCV_2104481 [Trichonephila clavipes]|nr:hypothetical protein TNCV_2104481 [Trichonephila clavipes]
MTSHSLSIICHIVHPLNTAVVGRINSVQSRPRHARLVRYQERMVAKKASIHLALHIGGFQQCGHPTGKRLWAPSKECECPR